MQSCAFNENLMKTTDRHLFAFAQIFVEHWPAQVNGRDFAAVLVRCSLVGSVVVLFQNIDWMSIVPEAAVDLFQNHLYVTTVSNRLWITNN